MKKVIFITFADKRYKTSLQRLHEQTNHSKYITDRHFFTEEDLGMEFRKKFRPLLYRRGYGYWQWKAYLVKKVMDGMDDGDILIWSDAGNEYNINAESRLKEYLDIVCEAESGLLVFSQEQKESAWTKGDCFEYFGVKDSPSITDSAQYWAGAFFIRKCEISVRIIEQWSDVSLRNFDLITDKRSQIPNAPDFIEHRHDQSVFSIVAKINKAYALSPKELMSANEQYLPIQPKRHKQKDIKSNICEKKMLPLRYIIGMYLKHFNHFYFRDRTAW